jgi:signal transduction histidine kinase
MVPKPDDFLTVFDQKAASTALVDWQGKVIYINDSLRRLTELEPADLKSIELLRLTLPAFRPLMMKKIASLNARNNGSFCIRCQLDIEKLKDAWIDVTVELIQSAGKEKLYYLVTLANPSEFHQGNFDPVELLSMVSHEMRTPLTAIRGAISIYRTMQSLTPDNPASVVLGMVERNIAKLTRISDDLLEYSSLENGFVRVEIEPISPNDVARNVFVELQSTASEKLISLSIEPGSEESSCWGDPLRLNQVVTNLVGNSLKYCPPETVVTIKLEETTSHTLIRIFDDGPGLPSEVQERIFLPFNKSGTPSDNEGSSGLGLRISKLLVESMGGEISLDMPLTGGTGYVISLAKPIIEESST